MPYKLLKILLSSFVLLLHLNSYADSNVPTVVVDQNTIKVDLTNYIEILPDPSLTLELDDVIAIDQASTFRAASEIGSTFGFSKSVYWVRFSLDMAASVDDSLLLEFEYPLMDQLTLFSPDGQGGFTERMTGEMLPFSTREVDYRNYLFSLSEHKGETRIYYLRLQTEGSMQIPLLLWTSSEFLESVDRANAFLGGYYGIMLLLLFVALTCFIKIGDKLFLSYAVYLLSYLLLQLSLNGFSFQYLWPDLPWLASRLTSVFIGLTIISGLIFSGAFLKIWDGDKHPRVRMLFYTLIAGSSLGVMLSLFGDYVIAVQLSAFMGILMPPAVLIGIISSMAAGYRPARYFLVAWSIFLFGVLTTSLLHFGLVPHTFVTLNAMQIGSTFEIILIGYALMLRFDGMRAEKEQAQQQANSYLKQLNEQLESLVYERTQTLHKKNKALSELAVRDSMTGLLNHNASIDYLKQMQRAALRYEHDLAVIMLDIDHFKSINDKHGHPAGDHVIIAIADILRKQIRESDNCGRYGGEEFILILHKSDAKSTWELAERTRKTILDIRIPEIDNMTITASLGIAIFDSSNPSSDLIAQADIALYQAKAEGRNQIVVFTPAQDENLQAS